MVFRGAQEFAQRKRLDKKMWLTGRTGKSGLEYRDMQRKVCFGGKEGLIQVGEADGQRQEGHAAEKRQLDLMKYCTCGGMKVSRRSGSRVFYLDTKQDLR